MTDSELETGSVWWIRHGPTHAKGMVGWSDLPADLSGSDALSRLSGSLPEDARVVSSDLLRATATADAIAGNRARLAPEPDLREMHFGAWELRRHDDIEAETPDLIRAFWDAPDAVRPPGGELWGEMGARVDAVVQRLLVEHPKLIVVAHFGPILSQARHAANWDSSQTFAQRVDPLSVTRIDYGETRRLRSINHIP